MKVYEFLKSYLQDMGFEENEIEESKTVGDLALDSTEKVDLALAIKDNLGKNVNLDDDSLTLNELVRVIEED